MTVRGDCCVLLLNLYVLDDYVVIVTYYDTCLSIDGPFGCQYVVTGIVLNPLPYVDALG